MDIKIKKRFANRKYVHMLGICIEIIIKPVMKK